MANISINVNKFLLKIGAANVDQVEKFVLENSIENIKDSNKERQSSNKSAIHSCAIHHLIAIDADIRIISRSLLSAVEVEDFDVMTFIPIFLLAARYFRDQGQQEIIEAIYSRFLLNNFHESTKNMAAVWEELEEIFQSK